MAILPSCCCWRSVRKGSFACGFYTAFYYSITAANSSMILHEEVEYFKNNCSSIIRNATFLDHDTTSTTSMSFTILSLTISSCGILTSCLLLYGLYKNYKILLIPWIVTIILFILQDVVYVVYHFIEHAIKFNPTVAILITVDAFIVALNIYALLCVISQYQELKAGRGRASDDENIRLPNVHYTSQPTATSYLSGYPRKTVTIYQQETRPTPTQSPTGTNDPHTSLGTTTEQEPSPCSLSYLSKGPRKSVKFPDESPIHDHRTSNNNGGGGGGSQLLLMDKPPWTIDGAVNNDGGSKSPSLTNKGPTDRAPLITGGLGQNTLQPDVLQSNL